MKRNETKELAQGGMPISPEPPNLLSSTFAPVAKAPGIRAGGFILPW
jgi:hypothetical protein